MNIPLVGFVGFLGLLGVLGYVRPHWLAALWPVFAFALPTTRTVMAGAPIYWYDGVAIALLVVLLLKGAKWPRGVPRWHLWFIGCGLVFGTLFPILLYGISLDLIYIWGHASIAWTAFAIAILMFTVPDGDKYRRYLGIGVMAAVSIFCLAALLQRSGIAMALRVNQFYRGDIGGAWVREDYARVSFAERPNGPFGSATTFAGLAVVVGAIGWLVYNGVSKKAQYVIGAAAGLTVIATVSRHAVVAVAIGMCVLLYYGRSKDRVRTVLAAAVLTVAMLTIGMAQGWEKRIARLEGGVLQDHNITARVIDGPLRLARLIEADPGLVITGTGLDAQKIARRGTSQVGRFSTGFVSNSFLLPLYALGFSGFLLTLAFWWYIWRSARGIPPGYRAMPLALVVMAVLIIAADNYAFIDENAVTALFLLRRIDRGRADTVG